MRIELDRVARTARNSLVGSNRRYSGASRTVMVTARPPMRRPSVFTRDRCSISVLLALNLEAGAAITYQVFDPNGMPTALCNESPARSP